MKKTLTVLLSLLMLGALTACGSGQTGTTAAASTEAPAVTYTVSEAIDKIYEVKKVELPLQTTEINLSDEYDLSSSTGLAKEDADKIEAAARSESMMGSHAYSLVMVKVKNSADAADLAQKMADGIDPRKWICVEADDMVVVSNGAYIMLYMAASDLDLPSKDMADAFTSVFGSIDKEYTRAQ